MPKTKFCRGHCCHRPSSNWEPTHSADDRNRTADFIII